MTHESELELTQTLKLKRVKDVLLDVIIRETRQC